MEEKAWQIGSQQSVHMEAVVEKVPLTGWSKPGHTKRTSGFMLIGGRAGVMFRPWLEIDGTGLDWKACCVKSS